MLGNLIKNTTTQNINYVSHMFDYLRIIFMVIMSSSEQ